MGFWTRAPASCAYQPLELSQGVAVGPDSTSAAPAAEPLSRTPGHRLSVTARTREGASHGTLARSPHAITGKSECPLKPSRATASSPADFAEAMAAPKSTL